jgi:hypothetical protein
MSLLQNNNNVSPLNLGGSAKFRDKLLAKNLAPYNLEGQFSYAGDTPGYQVKLSDDVPKDTPNISEEVFGEALESLIINKYGPAEDLIDFANKIIYVTKGPGTDLASTSKSLVIRTSSSTTTSYAISSTAIYSVQTPIVKLTQPLEISGNNNADVVTQIVNVGVKVKPQGVKVSVPTSITGSTITATTLIVGTGASNVESTLNNILTRLAVCETRLRI